MLDNECRLRKSSMTSTAKLIKSSAPVSYQSTRKRRTSEKCQTTSAFEKSIALLLSKITRIGSTKEKRFSNLSGFCQKPSEWRSSQELVKIIIFQQKLFSTEILTMKKGWRKTGKSQTCATRACQSLPTRRQRKSESKKSKPKWNSSSATSTWSKVTSIFTSNNRNGYLLS